MTTETLSPAVRRILARAQVEAESVGKDQVEPIHLLIGVIQEDRSPAALILQQKEITVQVCRDADFKK